MSVILQPQVAFPLVRQIANHTDSTVYYVRAVVRDAAGDTIDTVNLASQGNQRYQTSWRVPADTSGQGAYISVVTSVYTDSGYTSKSENYGDEETTYLIFDRVMPAMRGGGGGGLARRDVRDVIREELANLPKPEKVKIPDAPKMRFDEVLAALSRVKNDLETIPKERPDLAPILKGIEALGAKIDAKEVTPETDLKPVLEAVKDAQKGIGEGFADLATLYTEAERSLLKKVETTISEAMDSMELTIAPTVSGVSKKSKAEPEEEFDAKKFAI